MAFETEPRGWSQRLTTGHSTVAALAMVGAVALQSSWLVITNQAATSSSRYSIALTIVAATAWLISTAWFHRWLCRRGTSYYPCLLQAGTDSMVVAIVAMLLAWGHSSPLSSAGLGLMPPIVLAISATSAALLAMAAVSASNRANEGGLASVGWRRIGFAILLIASIGLLR